MGVLLFWVSLLSQGIDKKKNKTTQARKQRKIDLPLKKDA
jgi:hypothetical protein